MKLTDDPNWWEKALERGKKKGAFLNALDESFEHLSDDEQEKVFMDGRQIQAGCAGLENQIS